MKLTTILATAAFALASTGSAWSAEMTEGMIKKIDAAQNKVTIKHAALKALDMPSMTMVFFAGEGVEIAKLKIGQKIKFAADRVNGRITVTEIK